MAFDIKAIDLEPTMRDKVLFAVVALPLLSAFGAALRVAGVSEPVTLMVVIPLLCVAFVAWHIGMPIRRARRAEAESERTLWSSHQQSTGYLRDGMETRSR